MCYMISAGRGTLTLQKMVRFSETCYWGAPQKVTWLENFSNFQLGRFPAGLVTELDFPVEGFAKGL